MNSNLYSLFSSASPSATWMTNSIIFSTLSFLAMLLELIKERNHQKSNGKEFSHSKKGHWNIQCFHAANMETHVITCTCIHKETHNQTNTHNSINFMFRDLISCKSSSSCSNSSNVKLSLSKISLIGLYMKVIKE